MHLSQYYTQRIYSKLLVESLGIDNPLHALDLGFGSGELLRAARRRWRGLSLIGVDIDEENIERANKKKLIQALHVDGFNPHLPEMLRDKFGNIELLVSNPPYYSRENNSDIRQILKDSGLGECISLRRKTIPAEVIFLAQNLRILKAGGELGIILPAGIISGEKWKKLREYLFLEYNVISCTQLPSHSFKNTDAQVFILIIRAHTGLDRADTLKLRHANHFADIIVSSKEAISRADYSYYKSSIAVLEENVSQINYQLLRGRNSQNELKNNFKQFIHTTKLQTFPSEISLPHEPNDYTVNTIPGDILVARVGRRCLGRVALVNSGSVPISDCIIIVRPETKTDKEKLWEKFSCATTKQRLLDVSLGVGAKYLTYGAIEDFLRNV